MTSRLHDHQGPGGRSGEEGLIAPTRPAGPPGPATEGGYEPGASPVLDIGGNVGAMVVYLAGPTRSGELEARPTSRPGARFHTGVHVWSLAGRQELAAVFSNVAVGDYELLDDAGEPIAAVHVAGGQVSEIDLRCR